MHIPGLGEVEFEEGVDWYHSKEMQFKILDGATCEIVIEAYDEDDRKQDFHAAIAAFMAGEPAVLRRAEADIFQYYRDMNAQREESDEDYVIIAAPADVWKHIQFGFEIMVSRGHDEEQAVYISITCNCDWEREHGLQIVLKGGAIVTKIGPYDGHLTNADAVDDARLANVIYRRLGTN